jgi:CcmD family protein
MNESLSLETPLQGTQTPDERSTSFQAVQGEAEHYSGETLLVSAYAILWVIIFGWVVFVWRKQNALDSRLGDLEREIDKADEKKRS